MLWEYNFPYCIVNIRELLDQLKTEMVFAYWKALRKDAEDDFKRILSTD